MSGRIALAVIPSRVDGEESPSGGGSLAPLGMTPEALA
jgi:hypothetical protein